ncbi:GntR family transcriptional regulator [bacterium]|nr:GntR family transcriptional regulator [bacterium]
METKRKKLREKIISYLMKNGGDGGNKITEESIASYFKVSRTPVREVLKHLEQEGIIKTKRRQGITFRKFTVKDIREVYTVRCALEEFAITEGIKNVSPEFIKKLKEYVKMYRDARKRMDRIEGEQADYLFHTALIELSGNKYLKKLIDKINLFRDVFKAGMNNQNYRKYDPNPYTHTKIIKAIADGDIDKAKETIRNHILWVMNNIIKLIEKRKKEEKDEEKQKK